MTLTEFLYPLRKNKYEDLIIATMYYLEKYEGQKIFTTTEIMDALKQAGISRSKKINVADVLARAIPNVEKITIARMNSWKLTITGRNVLRGIENIDIEQLEIIHDTSKLEVVINSISDENIADYIQEAVNCLSINALRAAVVFVWAGAVRSIQEKVLAKGLKTVNDVLLKRDKNTRKIKKIDDFAYVKESMLLLVAQDLGVFDKGERDILGEALNLRNKCGHPGKYNPGLLKVSSFIEDVVSIVFS